MSTVHVNGRDPSFITTEVTENTKVVFIDDVKNNFSFESLFQNISGDWFVKNKRGVSIIPFSKSPKIYITTDHALKGKGYSERQWLITFSDFYNAQHKPIDDFGVLFFEDWGFDQWNLLCNLMLECIQLYLTYGVVQAPKYVTRINNY